MITEHHDTICGSPIEEGDTVEDARLLLKKATAACVAVPTGFNGDWDYIAVTKATLRRHLTGHRRSPFMRSRLLRGHLYIGSVHSEERSTNAD
ncbi:hypothetical protein [Bradyrhizobium sp. Ec3.3]|uniref:hypothetical protein n=1 Tax=Bradyrhizobium sp. Ec3.3 TaxID=189753 RepID=UPI000483EAF5|nr:hypothetical protein [Bradyrhizobium sp. Ec3.3]